MARIYVQPHLTSIDCVIFLWHFVLFVAIFLEKRLCDYPKGKGFPQGNNKHSLLHGFKKLGLITTITLVVVVMRPNF